jgi:hypothetical protein
MGKEAESQVNFQYSVIRVMPSTIAEECLNVGVMIKHADGVQFMGAHRLARIASAFPAIDEGAVEMCLAQLDELGVVPREVVDTGDGWEPVQRSVGPVVVVHV